MNYQSYIKQINNLSMNLKYLRIKRGLTVDALSKAIDVPKGMIFVYEGGYRIPSDDRIQKIAEFYGLSGYEALMMDHEEFVKKA